MTQIIPERVVYPVGPGPAPVCWLCFRYTTDSAYTADQRVTGGELAEVCSPCHRTALAGRPIDLPGAQELPELLRSWARWDVNGEVDGDATSRMLATLLPTMAEDERANWFECLQGALLEVQEHDEFGFELLSVPPEDRDCERLLADAVAKVDECVEALMGGAR